MNTSTWRAVPSCLYLVTCGERGVGQESAELGKQAGSQPWCRGWLSSHEGGQGGRDGEVWDRGRNKEEERKKAESVSPADMALSIPSKGSVRQVQD